LGPLVVDVLEVQNFQRPHTQRLGRSVSLCGLVGTRTGFSETVSGQGKDHYAEHQKQSEHACASDESAGWPPLADSVAGAAKGVGIRFRPPQWTGVPVRYGKGRKRIPTPWHTAESRTVF